MVVAFNPTIRGDQLREERQLGTLPYLTSTWP
jgi:hypothetical protein